MPAWAERGGTYEISSRTEYFDYNEYLTRVRRTYPNWQWRGVNDGQWRPPLTSQSEILEWLVPGTKFTVTAILYQAISAGKAYQAVEATVNNSSGRYTQSNLDTRGFVWIWHRDQQFFQEAAQQQPQPPEPEPERERRRHELTNDELINGWVPDHRYIWELLFPTFRLFLEMGQSEQFAESDKFTLHSTDQGTTYRKILYARNNVSDQEGYLELRFPAIRSDFKYTLYIEKAGGESYKLFEERPGTTLIEEPNRIWEPQQ